VSLTDLEVFGPVRTTDDGRRHRRRVLYRAAYDLERAVSTLGELDNAAFPAPADAQFRNDVARVWNIATKLGSWCREAAKGIEKPLHESLDASEVNALVAPEVKQ